MWKNHYLDFFEPDIKETVLGTAEIQKFLKFQLLEK